MAVATLPALAVGVPPYAWLAHAGWARKWSATLLGATAAALAALAKLVEERPSRGFWKCGDQLRRMRPDWNPKRIYRVYKAMPLNLRRAAKRRLPKRERLFERLKREHGLPQMVRSDNGPEFLGEAITAWAKANDVAIKYIQPGKLNQNVLIERFNRTFREEVLDPHLFARLEDVREAVHWWMIDYNETRPHDALGGLTPAEYRTQHAGSSTYEVST